MVECKSLNEAYKAQVAKINKMVVELTQANVEVDTK